MPYSKVQNSKFKLQNFRNSRPNLITPRGYSLIELLVVVAIMGILAAIGLANYNNFSARQEVKNAALELKSDLRRYQNFAISGQKNPDQSGACTGTMSFYSVVMDLPGTYTATLDCVGSQTTLANSPPWSSDGVTIFQVGYNSASGTPTPCPSPIGVQFRPINQGLDLLCGGIPIPTPNDRVYVDITNSSTIHYTVFVTNSGDIYETH